MNMNEFRRIERNDTTTLKLSPCLLEQLCTDPPERDAAKLLQRFDYGYAEWCESDVVRLLQLFLCAATERNHSDLVTLLLAGGRVDVTTLVDLIPSPLFLAIKSGNCSLVEIFLLASASWNLVKEHVISFDSYKMSAIEYACMTDQRKILKLLVSYHTRQYNKRLILLLIIHFNQFLGKIHFSQFLGNTEPDFILIIFLQFCESFFVVTLHNVFIKKHNSRYCVCKRVCMQTCLMSAHVS